MNSVIVFVIALVAAISFEEYRIHALNNTVESMDTTIAAKEKSIKDLAEEKTVLTVNNMNLKAAIKDYNDAVLLQANEAEQAMAKYKKLQEDATRYVKVEKVMPTKELDNECENIKAYIDSTVQFINNRLQ